MLVVVLIIVDMVRKRLHQPIRASNEASEDAPDKHEKSNMVCI